MFLINLLESEASGNKWQSWILIGVLVVLLIAFLIWSNVSNKKKQKQFNETLNAIKPGSKVKTIGGICGIVVSVNNEENTFVLKTGEDGKEGNYIKFDKQAIYQTDAKAEPVAAAKKEEKAEKTEKIEKTEEVKPADEAAAETADEAKETKE